MQRLKGRTAIVTGGASGIGRGTAKALARAGVDVVVADIDKSAAQIVADEIRKAGGRSLAAACDVARDDAFETLKLAALEEFHRIDIVMNNVGVLTRGRPEELPRAEWERVLNINLLSVVRSNLAFLPLLLAQGEGHIVNTASFAGLFTYSFDRLPYAATKAAIVQISEGLALYLRPKGIGVTCLCPGPVLTNIMRSIRSFSTGLDVRGPGPGYVPLQPEQVGEMVVNAIRDDRFMLFTHEQVKDQLVRRAEDWDRFIQERIDSPHIVVPASD